MHYWRECNVSLITIPHFNNAEETGYKNRVSWQPMIDYFYVRFFHFPIKDYQILPGNNFLSLSLAM